MTFVWMLRLPSTRRMFSFSATRRRAKARALTDDQARELMLAARDRRRRGGVRARVHDRSGLPAAAAEGAASCSRCRGPWAGFPVLFPPGSMTGAPKPNQTGVLPPRGRAVSHARSHSGWRRHRPRCGRGVRSWRPRPPPTGAPAPRSGAVVAAGGGAVGVAARRRGRRPPRLPP